MIQVTCLDNENATGDDNYRAETVPFLDNNSFTCIKNQT